MKKQYNPSKSRMNEILIEKGIYTSNKDKGAIKLESGVYITKELLSLFVADVPLVNYGKQKDLATTFNVSRQTISNWEESGKAISLKEGFYDIEKFIGYLVRL